MILIFYFVYGVVVPHSASPLAKNPRLIERKLKERMTRKVLEEARKLDSFKETEAAIDKGRREIERLEARINDQTKRLQGQALKAVMETEAVKTARAKIDELDRAGRRMEIQLQSKLKNVGAEFVKSGAGKSLKAMQDAFTSSQIRIKRMLDPSKTPKDLYEANITRSVIKSFDETNRYSMGETASAPRDFGDVMMDDFSFQD